MSYSAWSIGQEWFFWIEIETRNMHACAASSYWKHHNLLSLMVTVPRSSADSSAGIFLFYAGQKLHLCENWLKRNHLKKGRGLCIRKCAPDRWNIKKYHQMSLFVRICFREFPRWFLQIGWIAIAFVERGRFMKNLVWVGWCLKDFCHNQCVKNLTWLFWEQKSVLWVLPWCFTHEFLKESSNHQIIIPYAMGI